MKRFKFYAVVLLVMSYGCSEEFVTDTKTDGLSDETVFGSESTAVASVTGIYDAFQGEFGGQAGLPNEYNTKSIFTLNKFTQDFIGNGNQDELTSFIVNANDEVMGKMWPIHYNGIGRANSVLANLQPAIDAGNIGEELGSRLIGESLVLRAIFYYYLSSTMGAIPLITEPTGPSDDFFAPRNTQDNIFRQIVIDMTDAVSRLPWSYDNEKGRVTKGTAYAMLGSAHMWLGEYQEAVLAFETLEGNFSLEENFFDIHALSNKNGKESIFELQFDTESDLSWNRNDETTFLTSFTMPNEIGGGGFGGLPTEALFNSFEDGDLRRNATVIGPGEEHPDPSIDISTYERGSNSGLDTPLNTVGTVAEPWTNGGRTGFFGIKQWRDPSPTGWGGPRIFGGSNHIWLRYGEVLLSLAEAAHKSGDDSKAMATIMRVRNRAWGGTAPVPTGSMMDIIFDEYRHEIGGEFSLWPVLRRTGDASGYLFRKFGISTTEEGVILPIPRNQIDINPQLLEPPVDIGN